MRKEIIFVGLIILIFLYLFHKPITTGGKWIVEKVKGLYDDVYKRWGDLRRLDWKLLKAIARVESNENPNAIGDDGKSFGLMQVGLVVGSSYGLNQDDLFNPELNIQAGSGFLKEMIDKYGLTGGIQAYNLGETKFRRGLTSPNYLDKVLKEYENLRETEV